MTASANPSGETNLQQKAAVAKQCRCNCEVYLSPMRCPSGYPDWRHPDRRWKRAVTRIAAYLADKEAA
jgi:hypothetical protein